MLPPTADSSLSFCRSAPIVRVTGFAVFLAATFFSGSVAEAQPLPGVAFAVPRPLNTSRPLENARSSRRPRPRDTVFFDLGESLSFGVPISLPVWELHRAVAGMCGGGAGEDVDRRGDGGLWVRRSRLAAGVCVVSGDSNASTGGEAESEVVVVVVVRSLLLAAAAASLRAGEAATAGPCGDSPPAS